MQTGASRATQAVRPALRYRDTERAVAWLGEALGFEILQVKKDENGHIVYAELAFGESVVVLGSVSDGWLGGVLRQPDELAGAATQICALLVEDAAASFARATAANAKIIDGMASYDGRGASFTCRDPEGHIWHVATHPAQFAASPASGSGTHLPVSQNAGRTAVPTGTARRVRAFALATAAAIAGTVVGAYFLTHDVSVSADKLAKLQGDLAASADQVKQERSLRVSAERSAEEVREQLRKAQEARQAAERSAEEARLRLDTQDADRTATSGKFEDIQQQLEIEREARSRLERLNEEQSARLDKETAAHHPNRQELEAARSALAKAHEDSLAAKQSGEALTAKLAAEVSAHATTRSKLEAAQADLANVKNTLGGLNSDSQSKVVELKSATTTLAAARSDLEGLKGELERERAVRRSVEERLETLNKELRSQQRAARERDALLNNAKEELAKASQPDGPTARSEGGTQRISERRTGARPPRTISRNSDSSDATPESTSKPNVSDMDAARSPTRRQVLSMQKELKRVGCLDGPVTGNWDGKSGRALNKFIDQSNHNYPERVPAGDLISTLRAAQGTVCP